MLRRLHHDQPESFAFTPANQAWAEAQITKYPEGREASAVIALLWRAQEQEGWLTRPAIEHVAEMLGMANIRVLEVATFYFMFQLQPVGSVANIQICGTTSCMICGAEDLMAVCQQKIAANPHEVSGDGKLSWEEVECLGACANAPMAQIGKDYYEDLTAERLGEIIDELRAGKVPLPGPQNGRYASEPLSGLTTLTEHESGRTKHNASVQRAVDLGDTIKRIDGREVPLLTPWSGENATPTSKARAEAAQAGGKPARAETPKSSVQQDAEAKKKAAAKAGHAEADHEKVKGEGDAERKADIGEAGAAKTVKVQARKPTGGKTGAPVATADAATGQGTGPATLSAARDGKADNLKAIKGVGQKLEKLLNSMGFYHFDQIAKWTDDELGWVDENLEGFKGRARRDDWVGQARTLAEGGQTEFSTRVKKGDVY